MTSKVNYSSCKRKGSKSQHSGASPTEWHSVSKRSKEKAQTTTIGLDAMTKDTKPILTTQTEIDLRSKCITDYLIYTEAKNKQAPSIFDKYIK